MVFINDIFSVQLSEGSSLLVYADDILLFKPCPHLLIKHDVNLISAWISSNYLTASVEKSKCMLISRSCSHRLNLYFFLKGKQLEQVKHFMYLSLWISDDLSWLKQFAPMPGACLASSIVFSHPIVMPTLFCLYIGLGHTSFPSLTMPV